MGRKSKVSVKTDDIRQSGELDKVQTFKIVLLHSLNDTYIPGQFVEGHVTLGLKHGIVTRGIVLHFCGTVALHWTEKVPGKGAKCVDTVEFDATEEYFNVKNYLHEPGFIKPDTYEFPFRFFLSPPLPESYADNICQIQYYLEARLKEDTLTVHDLCDRKEVLVLSPLDLNEVIIPDVTLPVFAQRAQIVQKRCQPQAEVVAFLRLERAGYSPGETIHVQADLINDSSRRILSTSVSLIEERIYYAEGQTLEHREALAAVRKDRLEPMSDAEWRDIDLQVPRGQLFNVSASKIFTIKYFIEMSVNIDKVKQNLVVTLDITLGAVPLQQKTLDKPTHQRLQTPTRQTKRPTVAEIEAERKQELNQPLKTRLPKDPPRQRRRIRDQVVVKEETDTTDYLIYAEEVDLYKHRERQGYCVLDEEPMQGNTR